MARGGIIVVWVDERGGGRAIYAQRIDRDGIIKWTTNGVAVTNPLTDLYTDPCIVSDDAGGAIIAWADRRNSMDGVYAQRIRKNGSAAWAANGIAVSPNIGVRYSPRMIRDGSGGVILTWRGFRNSHYNIYAQGITAAGGIKWGTATAPVPVAVGIGYKEECELTTDGQGGAIITWYDQRNGKFDIFAQRVRSTGAVAWTLNGVPVRVAAGDAENPRIASDGMGGAVIAWGDNRTGSAGNLQYDVYAQRVNGAGQAQWAANGTPVAVAPGVQWKTRIASADAGSVVIAWTDKRIPYQVEAYAQKLTPQGAPVWAANGIMVGPNLGNADEDLEPYELACLDDGDTIFAWKTALMPRLYIQQLNHQGIKRHADAGKYIDRASTTVPPDLIRDEYNGVTAVWERTTTTERQIVARQITPPQIPAAAADWELFW